MDLQSTRMMLHNSNRYLLKSNALSMGIAFFEGMIFYQHVCQLFYGQCVAPELLPLPFAGISVASDWDETQPMEEMEMNFDMAMPLTEEEEQHTAALVANSLPEEAWALFFQICMSMWFSVPQIMAIPCVAYFIFVVDSSMWNGLCGDTFFWGCAQASMPLLVNKEETIYSWVSVGQSVVLTHHMSWHSNCPLAIQSASICQVPVLTRRDQLKMKQAKADEKKKAKDAKKEEKKSKEDPGDEAEKPEKRARGRKRTPAEPSDAGRAEPKAKGRRRTQPKDEGKEEEVENAEENQENFEIEAETETKPTSRPKRAPRAKRADPAEEEKKPMAKVAPKRKAKSAPKRAPKAKSGPKKTSKAAEAEAEESSKDEIDAKTPRKELFQSDEESSDEASAHDRVDKKSGKVKPLSSIFEEDAPEQWRRSRASNDGPSASSAAAPPPAPAVKPKGKGRGRKAAMSPMAKKLAKKRKQAMDDVMHEQLKEDAQLQGIFCQHLKAIGSLTYDSLKEYLVTHAPKDCNKFLLDAYWGRTACGVKSKELGGNNKRSMPLVSYFASFGTASTWNVNMTLTYLSAWLMAAWLVITGCAFSFQTSSGLSLQIPGISKVQLHVCWHD